MADDNFNKFWTVFPRRQKKKDAWKAWGQVKGDDHIDAILAALEWQCRQPQWAKDDGQYIPLAASWLRDERWEDEPVQVPQHLVPSASQRPMTRQAAVSQQNREALRVVASRRAG